MRNYRISSCSLPFCTELFFFSKLRPLPFWNVSVKLNPIWIMAIISDLRPGSKDKCLDQDKLRDKLAINSSKRTLKGYPKLANDLENNTFYSILSWKISAYTHYLRENGWSTMFTMSGEAHPTPTATILHLLRPSLLCHYGLRRKSYSCNETINMINAEKNLPRLQLMQIDPCFRTSKTLPTKEFRFCSKRVKKLMVIIYFSDHDTSDQISDRSIEWNGRQDFPDLIW